MSRRGLIPCCTQGGADCTPGTSCDSRIEVFLNGKPLLLARWPNINASTGYWEWGSVQAALTQQPDATFTIATAASASCTNPATTQQLTAWAQESDLWTHGYW